jgi:putative oxidoreductase
MCLEFLDKYKNTGLLILRIGIGVMFMFHGYGKLSGGPELWTKVGSAVSFIGIGFGHQFFGLLASLTEFVGGLCFATGVLFRPACFFLFFVMSVAATMHLSTGDGLKGASHAIELGIVFISFVLIGPGTNTLGLKLKSLFKNKIP